MGAQAFAQVLERPPELKADPAPQGVEARAQPGDLPFEGLGSLGLKALLMGFKPGKPHLLVPGAVAGCDDGFKALDLLLGKLSLD